MAIARQLWQRLETLHAVTYFAPESIAAAKDVGLRGFWMGYFGFRAAPMGPVGPGPVVAAFSNFHASMVERAVPDAWSYAPPDVLLRVRARAAAAALRARCADVDRVAEGANDPLSKVVAAADPSGRPLFASNREVEAFDDPVEQLWQHATTLREHRGDGHVASLVAAGIDGCESHLLLLAEHGTPPGVVLDHRGWSEADVAAATDRLQARGLLESGRLALTEAGRMVRHEVETTTDLLAGTAIDRALDHDRVSELIDRLTAPAAAVVESGVLPFPNPMGLQPLADEN